MDKSAQLRATQLSALKREGWWPVELGMPATYGSTEHLRYASFPAARRLVIQRDGVHHVYDTKEYQFRGVLQSGMTDGHLSFLSQYGRIGLERLQLAD